MYSFGPVPSRRLGISLGINNIPPKTCTYSCVYCQLGRTSNLSIKREQFYPYLDIVRDAENRAKKHINSGGRIDYITFVPDGEPTLDINLGKEIELLKSLGIPIAVITNSSLVWMEDVRDDLIKADLVSLKIDAIDKRTWKLMNRPHKLLSIEKILEGIEDFAERFRGKLITETMILGKISYEGELEKISSFLSGLKNFSKAYISVPTRPPAENWVEPPNEELINMAFNVFAKNLGENRVELLTGSEGLAFATTGNVKEDILSITSVHPMRKSAVEELLRKANSDWGIVEALIREGLLVEIEYRGEKFYLRKFKSMTRYSTRE